MSTLFQYLAHEGGVLLAAATCLLAIGCVGVALQRSPIHRQRAGEMAILGVLAALILACVPLPRYRLPDLWPAGPVTPNSLRPAEAAVESPPPVFEPLDEPPLAQLTVEDGPPMPADRLPPEVGTAADQSGIAVVMLPEPREPPAVVEPEPLPNTEVLQPTPDGDRTTVTVGRSSSAAAAPAFDVRYPLSIGYIGGMLGCLVWLAFGRVLLVRMLWSARPPEPWLREAYQQLPFARRRRPRLLISQRCTRALSFGVWRPTIVLPGAACRADRAQALRYVLLHELAHARQGDGWGHLLFNVAFPLLYFHPLYWWIRSRAYLAAELIADDWAAGRRTKESYVEALIALAKQAAGPQFSCAYSLQIFGSRSQFYRRMQMLLDRKTRLARRCSPLWRLIYPIACLAVVVLVAGAAGVRPAEAQSNGAATPAVRPVAVATPAPEDTVKPPADPDLILDEAAQLAAAEADEAQAETRQLTKVNEVLRAERDQLRAELQALKASVDSLKQMVVQLKAEQAARAARGSSSRTPAPKAMPVESPTLPTRPTAEPLAPDARGSARSTPSLTLPPLSLKDRGTSMRLAAVPGGAGPERRGAEGTRLDLVSLATSSADAAGDSEIAQLEYEGRKKLTLADPRAVPARELAIAEIRLKTARRKVDLLRSIAESAIMATEAEMDAAQTRLGQAMKKRRDASTLEAMKSEVIRAESKLRILKSILE